MKFSRTALLAALAVAFTFGSLNASARPGSVTTARTVTPSVARAVTSPTAAPATTGATTRAGGGVSSGMSRASVLSQARAQDPRNAAPAAAVGGNSGGNGNGNYGGNGGNGNYGGNTYNGGVPRQGGYTGGQVLGAAAAGAVGGYLLHGATQPNAPVIIDNNGGGYAGQGGGYVAPVVQGGGYAAPVVVTSSGMGFFGTLFLILVLGGIGYVVYRLFFANGSVAANSTSYASSASHSSISASSFTRTPSMSDDLLNIAPQNFRHIQDAYSRADAAAVAQLVDASYLPTFTADMQAEAGGPGVTVHSVKVVGNKVLGFEQQDSRYVGSIHFMADISEGNGPSEEIQELWHFVRATEGGNWLLAGIEQV